MTSIVPDSPWFLLYGGSSEDGNGPGQYLGRTDNPVRAIEFYREHIKDNPYSTGYIQACFNGHIERVDEKWLNLERVRRVRKAEPKPPLSEAENKPDGYGKFA